MYVFIDLLPNDTDNCFMSRSRIFHSILLVRHHISREGLQKDRRLLRLSREGSLSCRTCCDTGPRCIRSHLKVRPVQSLLTTSQGLQAGSYVGRKTTRSYGSLPWPPPLDMKYIIFWVVFFWLNEYNIQYFLQNDI